MKKKHIVVFIIFHFIQFYTYLKYSKFVSVSLANFVQCKTFISEEWYLLLKLFHYFRNPEFPHCSEIRQMVAHKVARYRSRPAGVDPIRMFWFWISKISIQGRQSSTQPKTSSLLMYLYNHTTKSFKIKISAFVFENI